ncbi:hypothetical protein HK100_012817 [Physocladia obscura]|uniref:Uncharacterized protein n=1 Tax=Physocladia obscura TaxID=109957 RepID=A0AAD5T8Z4_9FUNG|nr:hypothetical protein HK100_012817 [Physocladia obscura]
MSSTSSPTLTAAEKRRQRILTAGGDRLGKITGVYQGHSDANEAGASTGSDSGTLSVNNNKSKSRSAVEQPQFASQSPPAATATRVTTEVPTWTVPSDYRPTPRSALPQQRPAADLPPAATSTSPAATNTATTTTATTPTSAPATAASPAPFTALSAKKLAFGLLRIAAITSLVLFAVSFLSQSVGSNSPASQFIYDDDSEIEDDPVIWNNIDVSLLSSLAKKPITLDVAVPVAGFTFSIWGMFILFEILRQVVKAVHPQFAATPPPPPAPAMTGTIGSILSMAKSFAGSSVPGLVQHTSVFSRIRGIWSSITEDIGVFVVLFGLAVSFSSIIVANRQNQYQDSVNSAPHGGEF